MLVAIVIFYGKMMGNIDEAHFLMIFDLNKYSKIWDSFYMKHLYFTLI